MAVRFNPFGGTKQHGGSWIGPAGAEPFYHGQELVDCTAQEDFKVSDWFWVSCRGLATDGANKSYFLEYGFACE